MAFRLNVGQYFDAPSPIHALDARVKLCCALASMVGLFCAATPAQLLLGAVFTLADFAFAVACNTSDRVVVAVNMNLLCLKAVRSGVLHAEAVEISRSRRISTCAVRVTDASETLVAVFQGTAFIKDDLVG